ncbi:hypothetical protein [Streptomyces sp. NPDC021622]|uniref:hypothetical protein n=1 Tax=Streptomyces sp. NPDC021622 TaxID=3155013 RepID=UPI0033D0359C
MQRAENYYVPPYPTPADAWAEVPGAELVFAWLEARTGLEEAAAVEAELMKIPHPMNPDRPVPEEPGQDLPTVTR